MVSRDTHGDVVKHVTQEVVSISHDILDKEGTSSVRQERGWKSGGVWGGGTHTDLGIQAAPCEGVGGIIRETGGIQLGGLMY